MFGKLRLDADKGTVILRRVKVYFDDGSNKTFTVGRTLDAKHPSTEIDLGTPKAIDRVVTWGGVRIRTRQAVRPLLRSRGRPNRPRSSGSRNPRGHLRIDPQFGPIPGFCVPA